MTIPSSAKTIAFIVTADRNRAKVFYAGTLGFALVHEDQFAAVFDMNGTTLRISTVQDYAAQGQTVLGWEVDDIEGVARGLRDKGVTFNRYDGFEQDDLGIWTPPGGRTKVAWFNDLDGNVLSLTQF